MKGLVPALPAACMILAASVVQAQDPRTINVAGRQVRVQTAHLDEASEEDPIVVFEAGFMYDGLRAWTTILSDIAEFAPVIAYDRAGIGGSEPDGIFPTPQHVAENLHHLLDALGAEPPYVLVGHSLGGPFIRMFAELFPNDVRGLVFIDPTPTTSEEDRREIERAMGLTEASRTAIAELQREQLADMPSASVRAEAEMMIEARLDDWPDFQDLGPMPDVPVAILMAGRYDPRLDDGLQRACEPRVCHEREMAVRREWLAKQLQGVRRSWLIVALEASHFIQIDDPELVTWAIRRVWSSDPPRAEVRLPLDILEQYVGTYRRNDDLELVVTLERDQAFAQITGQRAYPIFAEAGGAFYYRVVDADLRFERAEGGMVTAVVLAQNGRQTRWERVR